MPAVLIEVRKKYEPQDAVALIDAVHDALTAAFKTPAHDKNIRLVMHEPHLFACPPQRAYPALSTQVTIDAFAGRSLEAKRRLYQGIVQNLEALGIPKDHVMIVVHDIPKENWGIRGGQAACDVDLGFSVDV